MISSVQIEGSVVQRVTRRSDVAHLTLIQYDRMLPPVLAARFHLSRAVLKVCSISVQGVKLAPATCQIHGECWLGR